MAENRGNFLSSLAAITVAVSIPVTLFILGNQSLDLRIGAFDSSEPKQIVISDVTDTSFKLSFITEKKVIGGVKLRNDSRQAVLESENKSYHQVVVDKLEPGRRYAFDLLIDGQDYFAGERQLAVETAKDGSVAAPKYVYGQVFDQTGLAALKEGLVDLQFKSNNQLSQILTTNLNAAGGYQIDIGDLRLADLSDEFIFEDAQVIITVRTTELESITKTYDLTEDFVQLPNMYTGDVGFDVIPGIDGAR